MCVCVPPGLYESDECVCMCVNVLDTNGVCRESTKCEEEEHTQPGQTHP